MKEKKKKKKRRGKVRFEGEEGGKEEEEQVVRRIFTYRKNLVMDELLEQEKHKEAMIILQCFRYFVKNNIV